MRFIFCSIALVVSCLLGACSTAVENEIASKVRALVKQNALNVSGVHTVHCLLPAPSETASVCSVTFHSSDRADVFAVKLNNTPYPHSFKVVFKENSGYLTVDDRMLLSTSVDNSMSVDQAASAIYAEIAESVSRTREKLVATR